MKQKFFKKYLNNDLLSNTRLLLILIVIFGLFLRLIFFSGIGISDSLVYSKTAHDIDKGIGPDISTLTLSTRLGIVYATSFSYKLWGINDFSSVLFVLITSIGSIILTFYFGKLLFNEKIGLLAAFLLSFFPLDVVYATKLLSDIPSAFFMALGVYIFLYAEIKRKLKYGLSYFLSGVFIGIGYLIRESALLIALFFIVYILYKKRIKKAYFLVPLGVLIIFTIEALIFLVLTQDPLFRMHAPQQHLEEVMVLNNFFGRLDFPTGLFHYPWLFLTNKLLLFFYVFIFVAIVYIIIFKKKETYIILFWFIPLLLYLSLGSASLTRYLPFLAKARYLSIINIAGVLLLAFFLAEKKDIIRKIIMPITLIVLLLTSIWFVSIREDRNLLDNLRSLYPFLKQIDKTIYIDDRSLIALGYISGYNDNIDIREYPNDLIVVKNSYVVINREMIRNLREANKNRVFPKEIDNPPKKWTVIKEIGKDDENKIIIYYAP